MKDWETDGQTECKKEYWYQNQILIDIIINVRKQFGIVVLDEWDLKWHFWRVRRNSWRRMIPSMDTSIHGEGQNSLDDFI